MNEPISFTNQEFHERLRDKLEQWAREQPVSIARFVLDFAYHEAVEEFNTEIINELNAEKEQEQENNQ